MSFKMSIKENLPLFGLTSGNSREDVVELKNNGEVIKIKVRDITNILYNEVEWEYCSLAIHNWIISNAASDTENQTMIEISEHELIRLRELCKMILKDVREAGRCIPSSSYNFNYVNAVYDTLSILTDLNLTGENDRWFIYQGGN